MRDSIIGVDNFLSKAQNGSRIEHAGPSLRMHVPSSKTWERAEGEGFCIEFEFEMSAPP